MKKIIIVLLLLATQNAWAQTSFDAVMDQYNEAYTSTNNSDSVNAVFEKIIDNAQAAFDAEIESQFNAEIAALEAEEAANKKELESLQEITEEPEPIDEPEPVKNYAWIANDYPVFWAAYQQHGKSYTAIARTPGVLTADMSRILVRMGLPSNGSEATKVERIITNL